MDQTTHDVRRANWLTVVAQCQGRPEGVSVRQWLSDNGVNEKSYYYWLRKFRKEAYEQRQTAVAEEQIDSDITFTELKIPQKTVSSYTVSPMEWYENPVAVIRCNGLTIGISNEISDGLLSRILKEVSHA